MSYRITKEKFLTKEELGSALKAALGTEYYFFFLLLAFTGARVQEILNLEYSKIPLDGSIIPIKGLKGSFDRDVFLPDHIATQVAEKIYYLAYSKPDSPLLFNFSYRRAVQVWEKIRPVKKPLKAFRHAFAINLYRKTKDVFFVKNALGHSCLSNTLVYVDYLTREQSLKSLKEMNLYGEN